MAKKTYIREGICIFCGMQTPDVSFYKKPHIVPRKMGGTVIGVDVCDKCNEYFGTPPDSLSLYPLTCSIEECVKEIMNLARFLLSQSMPNKENILRSRFFDFYASKSTIKIRDAFRLNGTWQKNFARQFKRGLCEMFLQSYHLQPGKSANEKRFDTLRNFARYNQGDMHLYYLVNRGLYLTQKDMSHQQFVFSESQFDTIDKYGFYSVLLSGHWFLLEVIPQTEENRMQYLKKEADSVGVGGFVFESIIEVQYITDIDFSLRRLLSKK